MVTITVTCNSWAPSSGGHLFTCGAIFWPPQNLYCSYAEGRPFDSLFVWLRAVHSLILAAALVCNPTQRQINSLQSKWNQPMLCHWVTNHNSWHYRPETSKYSLLAPMQWETLLSLVLSCKVRYQTKRLSSMQHTWLIIKLDYTYKNDKLC